MQFLPKWQIFLKKIWVRLFFLSNAYVFFSEDQKILMLNVKVTFSVVMCGCESWTIRKAEHRRIDAFELWCWRKLLTVPWTARRNQSWIFIGRTDTEVETPILWPADMKNWLIGKDPDAGKDRRQEEKGMTEDEMVGWHHQPDGHGFGWTLGVGNGQGGQVCCGSQGRKESDTTERLNWTRLLLST